MRVALAFLAASSVALFASSCDRERSKVKAGPPPLPEVACFAAIKQDVTDSYEFIGQTVAEESVDVVPMVDGYLVKQGFDEGSLVKKGDLLFEIDPLPYEAQVKNAEGQLESAKAQLVNAKIEYTRYTNLAKSDAVAQKDADRVTMSKGQAEGQNLMSEASLDIAKINLGYTKLLAPFDGKIGVCPISVGNLVQVANKKALTTIMRLDPMKVEFSIPEPAMANIIQKYGRVAGMKNKVVPRITLPNGAPYPKEGEIYFIDNQVDASTGTISIRARFANPDFQLTHNEYVKVRLSTKEPIQSILIPQIAIEEDMTGKFVMTVKDSKVDRRQVKTGQQHGTNIEIVVGVEEGEWVVVQGLLKIRPGMTVDAKLDSSASKTTQPPQPAK